MYLIGIAVLFVIRYFFNGDDVFFIISLALMAALAVVTNAKEEVNRELFILKNYKLRKENKDVEISSSHEVGDYFVMYVSEGKTIYEFYKSPSEQSRALLRLREEGLVASCGLRPTEIR